MMRYCQNNIVKAVLDLYPVSANNNMVCIHFYICIFCIYLAMCAHAAQPLHGSA